MTVPNTTQGIRRALGWSWGIRDESDDSVEYHWDLRDGKPAAATDVNSPTYDSVNGMNCAAGYTRFNGLDDTNIIEEGTIFLEMQRSILDWDNDTFASGFWVDSVGNTVATGSQYVIRIIENGASAREIFIFRNGASGGSLSIQCEGATDDTSQPINQVDQYGLQRYIADATEIETEWSIIAITWKSGRIYVMVDGQVVASFHRAIIDGDIDTLHLGGFGANPFTGYMRRVQILNECIAPTISGPRQCILGDSFGVRATGRTAPATEDNAGYAAVQGSRSYISGEPTVTGSDIWSFRGSVAWFFTGHFHILQRLATIKHGIWPPLFNASRNGAEWRSDLGAQISSAQTDYVIEVDPEILWCFGSVNDVDIADQTYDYVADVSALLDTIAAGCRNLRRIIFVETFATPDSIRLVERDDWKAALLAQRRVMTGVSALTATNARGVDVKVEWLPVWDQWAPGGTVPFQYCIGTRPDSDDPVTTGANGDIHPTAAGTLKMAEILWPKFEAIVTGAPEA